jgi:hypothetical protein
VRRHNTDPVALLAGALFITVGAAYLGGALSDTNIEARWVLPTVLITLGFTGLLVSLVNLARQRRTAGVTPQPVGGGEAPGADTTMTMPDLSETSTAETSTAETSTAETSTAETSTMETDNEPGDEPRDRV